MEYKRFATANRAFNKRLALSSCNTAMAKYTCRYEDKYGMYIVTVVNEICTSLCQENQVFSKKYGFFFLNLKFLIMYPWGSWFKSMLKRGCLLPTGKCIANLIMGHVEVAINVAFHPIWLAFRSRLFRLPICNHRRQTACLYHYATWL